MKMWMGELTELNTLLLLGLTFKIRLPEKKNNHMIRYNIVLLFLTSMLI